MPHPVFLFCQPETGGTGWVRQNQKIVGEEDGSGSNASGEDSLIFLPTGLRLVERSRMK
jgi:hypothetical protein